MGDIRAELEARIERLRQDRSSGASQVLDEVIAIFTAARAEGLPIVAVAKAVCLAQPSMASVWNAALAALASESHAEPFAQFVERVRRAPAALGRYAAALFADEDRQTPLHVVTISFSRSVLIALNAIGVRRNLLISCSESRPALEGRRLASELAVRNVSVTLFTDAAIAHALATADAVLVGADAVSPTWFMNKSGTLMLAAAAAHRGVPVYVATTRDKFVSADIADRLTIRDGEWREIWDAAPAGLQLRNPYFEPTPLDLVTSAISDIGVLGTGMIPDVCASIHDRTALQALGQLIA